MKRNSEFVLAATLVAIAVSIFGIHQSRQQEGGGGAVQSVVGAAKPGKDDARSLPLSARVEKEDLINRTKARQNKITVATYNPADKLLPGEMDIAVNPYAAALREPGQSKRAWDAGYIESFKQAKDGDPIRFELTDGVMADGVLKIFHKTDGVLTYVSGELTAPEKGKFFFLTPPAGSRSGKAVAIVEFPGSKTAYRAEPTGIGGEPELWKRHLAEVICMDLAKNTDGDVAEQAAENDPAYLANMNPGTNQFQLPSSDEEIISLQSYPGSPAVLLMDFYGGVTGQWGGVTYGRPNISNQNIKTLWERVSADYSAFNINVTTDRLVYDAAAPGNRMRCCFNTTLPTNALGVAYIGSWGWGGDIMCWSSNFFVGWGNGTCSHEVGHTLGLGHDGRVAPYNEGYFGGQGGGATSWGPIMGNGDRAISQWSKGEYASANNLQDDLSVITSNNSVAYRPDDTGSTLATSRYLDIRPDNSVFAEGMIERSDDVDAFQFTTTGGAVTLTASPLSAYTGDLAVSATLADAADNMIASANPQDELSATITANLPAGTYTFCVKGAGRKDPLTDGFSSYASLGYYSISGTVAGARQPTRLSVVDHAATNTVVGTVAANNPNSSPLTYSIASSNAGSTFSVDNNGVVRVANNALVDYYALAANPAFVAPQFDVFMNITNVNNSAFNETNRRVVITVRRFLAAVPVRLGTTIRSDQRADLVWLGDSAANNYNVKRSTTSGGPYTTVATTADPNYTDSGLIRGVTYFYVISAVNANGESDNSAEGSVTVPTITEEGFEFPLVNGGSRFNPPDSPWTFNGSGTTQSNCGILGNGSAYGNPTAPEGVQVAFVTGTGSISRTLSGFVPGTVYQVSYLAAERGGNSQTWDVKLDGAVIQSNPAGTNTYALYSFTFTASSATHTLTFAGTNLNGGDNTIFIDDVEVGMIAPVIPNASFETPTVNGAQYNPSGGSWIFNGNSPSGSGIVRNGGVFNNPASPLGVQAAFVQAVGTISQNLSGFVVGKTYTLTYQSAQRPGNNQSWNVKLNGTVLQSKSGGGNAYVSNSVSFVATSTSHTLSFVGTNLNGGDNTVFIDNVRLHLAFQTVAPTVALTSPANNSVYGSASPVSLTASVNAAGNLINAVQFYSDGTLIGQLEGPPYTWTGNGSAGRHRMMARVLFNNGAMIDSAPVNITVFNRNLNLGFETPSLGGGQYNEFVSATSWIFAHGGIASNGSGLGNPNAPEGTQVGYLQNHGSISQTLSGFIPGTSYTVSYSAAQRAGDSQTWDVKIDNTVIQSNTAGSSTFTPYTVTFTATSAIHTLSFVGTDLAGNKDMVFIDNVSFSPDLIPSQRPILNTDTSPATAVDVIGGEVTFSAAFSSSIPTTYQWQKIVNGLPTDIAGATTPNLTLSNLQLGDTGSYWLQATNSSGVSVSTARALTVTSLPAAAGNVITGYAAQTGLGSAVPNFSPTWDVFPGSLISTKSPASVGTGVFTQSSAVLTNGSTGRSTFGYLAATATQVTCGTGAGQSVTYNLGTSPSGYNLSNIVVYGGWCDAGRDQQAYTVSYSTASDPATFIQLAVVDYNPANPASVQSATRATLGSATSAPLASSVAALKFDFTIPATENGYSGYTEIAVYGAPLAPAVTLQTSPATARDVVGSQVTFTASIVGADPLSYQWQKVVSGVPGNIAGATGPSLTLTNLQLGDSASYQLRATNSSGSATSTPATLTVVSMAAAVNNVITSMAAQTGLGGNTTFAPSWTLSTANDLIDGLAPSSSAGNFNLNANGKTVAALTTVRSLAISPTTGGDNSFNYLSGGNGNGAGSSVVYTLPANISGHTLTKIIVHGGWADAGRDQVAYTVSYSKVGTPTTFVTLGSVNYNPANPAGVQSTTRSTLTPASGVLATNVAAVKFDFTTPASENGYVGYAQLAVYGAPTLSAPTNLAATAGDAEASLIWAGVAGATSYNVKRSTLSGGSYTTVGTATSTSLLDTGLTNGTTYYYVVTALNAAGETGPSSQASATPVSVGYNGWLAGYPTITGPDRAPDADADHDGVPNGIEFLTGTSPSNPASAAPFSTTMDGGGNLVLHFKRVDAAKAYTVAVESSTSFLPPWTSLIVTNDAITGPPLTVVENGTVADDVTVVIPSNGARSKFARIRISIPVNP